MRVLYDDGTFALRSPSSSFEVKGTYKYENEHVTFDFDWNSQNEGAVGVFDGNRMTVTYNWYMEILISRTPCTNLSEPAPALYATDAPACRRRNASVVSLNSATCS